MIEQTDGSVPISALRKDNLKTTLKDIRRSLSVDTPVLISHHQHHGRRHYSHSILFLSSGRVGNDGSLDIKKGAKNYSFAFINSDGSYRIGVTLGGRKLRDKIEPSNYWFSNEYNECTFSSGGGERWIEDHSSGISGLVIGDSLLEKYPEAINALKFVRDAIRVDVPFSRLSGTIYLAGETLPQSDTRRQEEDKHAAISYVMAMLGLVYERNKHRSSRFMEARELKCWIEPRIKELDVRKARTNITDEEYEEKKRAIMEKALGIYPLVPDDFAIVSGSGVIAYVKAGKGCLRGETYVLPVKSFPVPPSALAIK